MGPPRWCGDAVTGGPAALGACWHNVAMTGHVLYLYLVGGAPRVAQNLRTGDKHLNPDGQ